MQKICFIPGKDYWGRSIGDHNCIIRVSVVSRTKCFVRTTKGKRLKIHLSDNGNGFIEYVLPWGRYSMSPSVSADSEGSNNET